MRTTASMMPAETNPCPERGVWARIAARSGTGTMIVIVLAAAWEMITRALHIAPSVLPSPSRLILELWRQAPQLAFHAWITGISAAEGLLPAVLAALGLTTLACYSTTVHKITEPAIRMTGKMPIIAMAPLAVLWFGFGAWPVAALVAAVSFVALLPYAQAGFDSLPPQLSDYLTSIRAPKTLVFWKVRLPMCLPHLIRGLKAAMPAALAAAAVAEWIGSDEGLGFVMLYAGSHADSLHLFTALAVLILMAWSGCLVLFVAEEIWVQWRSDRGPLGD